MKILRLLLLSIFTVKNLTLGILGDDSYDSAIVRGKSKTSDANDTPLPRLRPQQERQRQQQQTLNYRANYTADFQHLLHPSCDGDAPFLGITCYSQKMEISNVSHPSIDCTKSEKPIVEGGTTYVCTNTCTKDSTCSGVYMVNDGVENAFDSIHGSIRFMCEGNSTHDLNALYILAGRTNIGSCIADSTATIQNNIRVARLGVSCPIATDGNNINDIRRHYVFEDTYFECSGNGTLSADPASPPNDVYTCFNGADCRGQGCNFIFGQMEVRTQVPSFVNECVQALVPIEGYPTPAPQAETLWYRVRYEASWISINANVNYCTSNNDSNPKIRMTCNNNGDSTILFVNATDVTMNCINVEQNTLQCTGDPNQILNKFTTVAYVSLYNVSGYISVHFLIKVIVACT